MKTNKNNKQNNVVVSNNEVAQLHKALATQVSNEKKKKEAEKATTLNPIELLSIGSENRVNGKGGRINSVYSDAFYSCLESGVKSEKQALRRKTRNNLEKNYLVPFTQARVKGDKQKLLQIGFSWFIDKGGFCQIYRDPHKSIYDGNDTAQAQLCADFVAAMNGIEDEVRKKYSK